MTLIIPLVLVFAAYVGNTHSQQHVHGQGSVFIIQEGNYWQFQITLPASDALGFEHAPSNREQKNKLSQLKQSLKTMESLMSFSQQCTQESVSHNLSGFEGNTHNHSHDADKHTEHNHEHQDVEVAYVIHCVNPIDIISFSIFSKMHSLEKLDVQWSIDNGQGSKAVSNNNRQLDLT